MSFRQLTAGFRPSWKSTEEPDTAVGVGLAVLCPALCFLAHLLTKEGPLESQEGQATVPPRLALLGGHVVQLWGRFL